jgi:hypothetical protein
VNYLETDYLLINKHYKIIRFNEKIQIIILDSYIKYKTAKIGYDIYKSENWKEN